MPRLNHDASLDLVTTSAATLFNKADLGTTPFIIGSAASPTMNKIRRCCITNKSASAYVAFMLTDAATVSPSFAASGSGSVSATEGNPVAPGSQYFINFSGKLGIWVVASAASTPMQVALYDTEIK